MPGAQILPLIEALADRGAPRVVCAAHELGAAFMADGYARARRGPGVCVSIGGPGAANMLTAAQAAQLDGSPVFFLTGDVPASLARRGAFQDGGEWGTRDVKLYESVVASSRRVRRRDELESALADAWDVLEKGKCVHLAVPVDVLSDCGAGGPWAREERARPAAQPFEIPRRLIAGLCDAREILILAGSRLGTRAGALSLRHFAERHGLPVLTTLAGKGLLPEDHPLAPGNCGFAGSRRANEALLEGRYDVLLVVGADFNERDSLAWNEGLRRNGRKIIRLDSAERPYRSPVAADFEYLDADPAAWLEVLAELSPGDLGGPRVASERWFSRHSSVAGPGRDRHSGDRLPGKLLAQEVIETVRAVTRDDAHVMVDGGMVRAFAGQGWQARHPLSFHSAASTAPTGWAIPAAMGLKLAEPQRQVVALTGDGCMLMHGIEIASAARYRIGLVVVVLDNGSHGAALRRANSPAVAEVVTTAPVDWPGFARTLGAEGVTVETTDHLASEVVRGLGGETPVLIHVPTDCHEPYAAAEHVFLSYSGYL